MVLFLARCSSSRPRCFRRVVNLCLLLWYFVIRAVLTLLRFHPSRRWFGYATRVLLHLVARSLFFLWMHFALELPEDGHHVVYVIPSEPWLTLSWCEGCLSLVDQHSGASLSDRHYLFSPRIELTMFCEQHYMFLIPFWCDFSHYYPEFAYCKFHSCGPQRPTTNWLNAPCSGVKSHPWGGRKKDIHGYPMIFPRWFGTTNASSIPCPCHPVPAPAGSAKAYHIWSLAKERPQKTAGWATPSCPEFGFENPGWLCIQ